MTIEDVFVAVVFAWVAVVFIALVLWINWRSDDEL